MLGLAGMDSSWIEQAVWPSDECTVYIALIPKPAGGERPIGLFRSIVRVVCKAAAWDSLKWFEAQDILQLNKHGQKDRRCNMEGADEIPNWHMQAFGRNHD